MLAADVQDAVFLVKLRMEYILSYIKDLYKKSTFSNFTCGEQSRWNSGKVHKLIAKIVQKIIDLFTD